MTPEHEAEIRARDAASGELWFTGPASFTALDRRTLLKELDELREAAGKVERERDALQREAERLKVGLGFYAEGHHFEKNETTAWDTVSGEPQNFWCDDACTATVEDGTIAKQILAGWSMPDDPDAEEMIPPDAECPECFGAGGVAPLFLR